MKPNMEMFRAMRRESLYEFTKDVFRELHPNTPFKDNWHIEATTARLEAVISGQIRRLIINQPPRSLKSLIASVALPAFLLGKDPSTKLICISYSSDLSLALARQFRQVVLSEWYKELFPRTMFDKLSEAVMETTRGGARRSTSFEAGITGHGGNVIIIDDPLTPTDALSSLARKKVITYYTDSLSSRFDDPAEGRMIVVQQRLHEEDLSGYLIEKGGFDVLSLPVIATEDREVPLGVGRTHVWKSGELLHPERLPQSIIDSLRATNSAAAFSAQYQQRPVPNEGTILKRDWIQRYTRRPGTSGMRIVQSWDTANKGSPEADYSVCTTWVLISTES